MSFIGHVGYASSLRNLGPASQHGKKPLEQQPVDEEPPPSLPPTKSCYSIKKSISGIIVGLKYRMQKTCVALQIPKSKNTLNYLPSNMAISKQKVSC